MSKLKKIIATIMVCVLVVGGVLAITGAAQARGGNGFDGWEEFYSFNKVIFQRHSHPRKLMRLPIYRMAHNYNSGVACVQSILRYTKYEFDIREDNLARALGSTEEDGTDWRNIVDYLNSVRLDDSDKQWFEVTKKEHMTVDDLIKELKQGHPVICDIQAWNWDENEEYSMNLDYSDEWECGHYVVAVGYTESGSYDSTVEPCIYFMDPSTGGNYTFIPKSKLFNRWHDYQIDENNQREDLMQMGLVVNICGTDTPDGERYYDAFYALM